MNEEEKKKESNISINIFTNFKKIIDERERTFVRECYFLLRSIPQKKKKKSTNVRPPKNRKISRLEI